MNRPPRILHCTSEPLVFFGRQEELQLLNRALSTDGPSLVALVGPGGQGKTAIVHHWLHQLPEKVDGLFFWSFYRGKEGDLCLREWLAYAEGLPEPPAVSASWCVERLLTILRRERWAIVLDGTEVVQYEEGPWQGRFTHPDLGFLLEELATEPMPGVLALTTRFSLPTLERRGWCRIVSLERLDPASARELLRSLGVHGEAAQLDHVAAVAGRHAKAVELLGTYLVRFHHGRAAALDIEGGEDDEEASVARVLAAFLRVLPPELQDLVALATAFRDPPTERLLLDYLNSPAVRSLLHTAWQRTYLPFAERGPDWLASALDDLIHLRLLERVGPGTIPVIDAHPLVRRGFEHVAGPAGRREFALARAGFLRGRPDRRRPSTLEEAREAIELFHAHCDAGLWAEADSAYRALENPKHRLLAPTLERQLLLRFFPGGDWRQPPLWPGFGRWRSLAICSEMLGAFEDALDIYRPEDAPLRGDAFLALGRFEPLLKTARVPAPWDALWQAYRAHALALAGRCDEAVALARSLVPQDVYEWVHVFEALLRAGQLDLIDPRSLGSSESGEPRWTELARQRMRLDHARICRGPTPEMDSEYLRLTEEYDRAGLPVERLLTRLGHMAYLVAREEFASARILGDQTLPLIEHGRLAGWAPDVWDWRSTILAKCGDSVEEAVAVQSARQLRENGLLHGPRRP